MAFVVCMWPMATVHALIRVCVRLHESFSLFCCC